MKLPSVRRLMRNGDDLLIDLAIPSDLEGVRGHFPGQPILPGVLQVDWAVRFAAEHFALDRPVASDFQVKFRQVIRPDQDLSLALRLDRQRRQVVFEYRVGVEIASSGKIKLEPPL